MLPQHSLVASCRPVTLQDILKCCDIGPAVSEVSRQLPSLPQQTVELAVTFCLGDVDAAMQLLTSTSKPAAMPPGGPTTTNSTNSIVTVHGSVNLQHSAGGARPSSWLENTGELAQCMSSALNIANELKVFTDKLVALQQQQGSAVLRNTATPQLPANLPIQGLLLPPTALNGKGHRLSSTGMVVNGVFWIYHSHFSMAIVTTGWHNGKMCTITDSEMPVMYPSFTAHSISCQLPPCLH